MCNADMTEHDPEDLLDDKYLLEVQFLFLFSFILFFPIQNSKKHICIVTLVINHNFFLAVVCFDLIESIEKLEMTS